MSRVTKKRRAEVAATLAARYARRVGRSLCGELGYDYERAFWKRLEALAKHRGEYLHIGYPTQIALDQHGFYFRPTGDDYSI